MGGSWATILAARSQRCWDAISTAWSRRWGWVREEKKREKTHQQGGENGDIALQSVGGPHTGVGIWGSSVSFSLVRGVELKCLASRTMWSVWGVKNFGNVLKVKWILQLFYRSEGFILRSTQMFFVWPNFPCTTKHTGECKIFSQIHFQLKQTQP